MDIQEELDKQLHSQYSENDNSRSGIFLSFIMGIIALFGTYGYVFIHTNINFDTNIDKLLIGNTEFALISVITIGILFFLAVLSLHFGYSLRRDQIVINNIRNKYYTVEKKKETFGDLYKSNNKNYFSFLPDFYNLFYWLFFCSEIFIFFTTILKIYKDNWCCILVNFIFTIHIIAIILSIVFRCCYYEKYLKKAKRHKTLFLNGIAY